MNNLKYHLNLHSEKVSSPDILNGELSLSVYHGWMAYNSNVVDHQSIAFQHTQKAIEKFQGYQRPNGSFANGLAGLGFTLNFLNDLQILEPPNSLINNIDQIVLKWSKTAILSNDFDPLHGAGGSINYLLSRIGSTISIIEFIDLIKQFLKIGIRSVDGIYWQTPKIYLSDPNEIVFNLSLSHGASGILILLNRIYERDICKNEIKEVIELTLNYILNNETDQNIVKSFYATRIVNGVVHEGRLSWCYGDLGLLLALQQLNSDFNTYKNNFKIEEMINYHTTRRGEKDTGVDNPGFCHGSSGLYFIFDYLKNFSDKKETFCQAQNHWESVTRTYIDQTNFDEPYYTLNSTGEKSFQFGLIEGLPGIVLAMNGVKSINDRKWSEIFQIY